LFSFVTRFSVFFTGCHRDSLSLWEAICSLLPCHAQVAPASGAVPAFLAPEAAAVLGIGCFGSFLSSVQPVELFQVREVLTCEQFTKKLGHYLALCL
jgi:hypothetical protein